MISGFDKGLLERIAKSYPGTYFITLRVFENVLIYFSCQLILDFFFPNYINVFLFSFAGRASASPPMDVFITLLSLGVNGYRNLITQRKEMYKYLKEELSKVASKHGEKILDTKSNPISIG